MSMTVTRTYASVRSLLGLSPDCSVDRCFRPSTVALMQTHPLWSSPLRINVCTMHKQVLVMEAKAAGVTVTEHRV
jgi:hypothetical protein